MSAGEHFSSVGPPAHSVVTRRLVTARFSYRRPSDRSPFVVHHLHRKMSPADFVQGARVWMAVLRDQHAEEYRELLLELSQQEQQPA